MKAGLCLTTAKMFSSETGLESKPDSNQILEHAGKIYIGPNAESYKGK